MRRLLMSLFCLFVVASTTLVRAADEVLVTDPALTGADYDVQGEYAGKLDVDGEPQPFGAQVIALGDSKFDIVVYVGGLPGRGWLKGGKREKATGETKEGLTTFSNGEHHATIQDGVLTIDGVDGELKKIVRKSPTLGAKPPKGATVLFDGSSAENFIHGHLTMKNLLAAGCETKEKFGDHTLHLEFRTPFKPAARGQARGNSGVYLQNRYECQVLDSFGLEGKNNECGGIYSISEPLVNACFPPLTWQTYDIEFTAARYEGDKKIKNARATIRQNGIVIHNNLELTHGTPGKNKEGAGPDGFYLQGHGNPVVYRNIWIIKNDARTADAGWKSLFDGKTLKNWDGNPKFWSVVDGCITGQTTKENPTKGNTFIIYRGEEFGDFELKLQYKIVNGNSGIQYRSFEVEGSKWVVGGYQADFEAGTRYSGINYGERFRGILADRSQRTVIGNNHKPRVIASLGDSDAMQKNIKSEDWNDYHIIAHGNHLIHKINGTITSEVEDEDKETRRSTGILALQLHAGPAMTVQFRHIRVKTCGK